MVHTGVNYRCLPWSTYHCCVSLLTTTPEPEAWEVNSTYSHQTNKLNKYAQELRYAESYGNSDSLRARS